MKKIILIFILILSFLQNYNNVNAELTENQKKILKERYEKRKETIKNEDKKENIKKEVNLENKDIFKNLYILNYTDILLNKLSIGQLMLFFLTQIIVLIYGLLKIRKYIRIKLYKNRIKEKYKIDKEIIEEIIKENKEDKKQTKRYDYKISNDCLNYQRFNFIDDNEKKENKENKKQTRRYDYKISDDCLNYQRFNFIDDDKKEENKINNFFKEEKEELEKLENIYKNKENIIIKENNQKKIEIIEELEETEEIKEFKQYLIKKDYIMTRTEKYFFNLLSDYIKGKEYMIFSKVRLADIVTINNNKEFRGKVVFNKIKSKHIDFVITDLKGKILKCIELDDYSHNKEIRGDEIKNIVLKIVNVEFIRFKVANNYDFKLLNLI